MRVLLACARARLRETDRALLLSLLDEPLDWDRLIGWARRHKMLPLVASHLAHFAGQVPAEAQRQLRSANLANGTRMLRLAAELIEILELFQSTGIPAIPYKGPVLGAQLYGNVALRQSGDLDILVRRQDVSAVRVLLLARGYHQRHALNPGAEQFLVASRYSEEFERVGGPQVEIHWAFTNGDIALPLEFESLQPHLEPVLIGRKQVLGFGREDLLLVLCVHGSKHRWDRLEWICGLAEAINGAPDTNWDGLLRRARHLGVRRMVLLGLLLARDLLGAAVPEEVVRAARADRSVSRLAEQIPALMVAAAVSSEIGSLPVDLFRLQLRERRRDRLRFILYRLTTPSRPESWEAVSVGGRLIPIHAFRRPFVLIGKLLPAIRSYLRSGFG